MSSPKTRDSLVVIAIWAYCLSLAFPAFYTKAVTSWEGNLVDDGPTWYGIGVLVFGWLSAIGNPNRYQYWSIAWFANPLFFLALSQVRRSRPTGFLTALFGLSIALTSIFKKKIWNDKEPPEIVITDYGIGFYLWLLAFVMLSVAAWNVLKKNEV